jgi:hypothetical protein
VKVLLVVKSKFMESLGVMYLSSVIKASHECKIVALSEAEELAQRWAPDIVGLSIMTGDMEKFKALRFDKRVSVVVGGPDPTFFPEGYDWADNICRGEGEVWMMQYLSENEFFNKSFFGIDDFLWPDRTDFPNMKIRDFISSRGCPYRCRYCYNAQWSDLFPDQKGVRVRKVDDVIAEIKSTAPEYVYFQDSCFGVRMDWMTEWAEKFGELKLPYQCNFRPEQITQDRVELLNKSGCVAVRIALESATNRLRSLVGRNSVQLKKVREASELLSEYGIMLMLQNIIGLPTATIEDDLFTLECNIKYRPTYAWVSIFQPYPGTELGEQCKAEGWYKGDYSDISDSFFDTSYLEIDPVYREQLEVLQKVFAFCVDYQYLPTPEELTYQNLPKLIHKITRTAGDKKLYLNLLG